jgi:hypothetical protein
VGSFTGCVYDKKTQEPVKGASILLAYSDDPYHGKIVIFMAGIPDATHYRDQGVKTGDDGCFYFKLSNELESKLQERSVSGRAVAVFGHGYESAFFDLKIFLTEKNKPIYIHKPKYLTE